MNRLILSFAAMGLAAALSACTSQAPAAPTIAEAVAAPPASAARETSTEIVTEAAAAHPAE